MCPFTSLVASDSVYKIAAVCVLEEAIHLLMAAATPKLLPLEGPKALHGVTLDSVL